MMVKTFVSRPLAVFHSPVAAPVIKKRYRTVHPAACHFTDRLQRISHFGHFLENPCIISAVMIDNSSVEFLRSSPALPDLEIKSTLSAMSNGLHGLGKEDPRFFQLTDALPVGRGRTGFHLEERFPLQRTHQVMAHGIIPGHSDILCFSPGRIRIPGDHIDIFRHLEIIQTIKIIHQVGRYRQFTSGIPYCLDLPAHEITGLMRDKAFPVQIQRMKLYFADLRRALDVVKALVGMAPECRAPAAVEILNGLIFFLQPVTESGLAERTMALSSIFVGNMPEDHCRMISEAFRQFLVDDPYLFPVNRRCIAMIVSGSKKLPSSGLVHPKHFRIFISQPFGTGTGGCRKDHADSFRIEPVNHLFHPVQTEHALFRFQGRPGENTKAHHVAAGFCQHFHILFQDIRSVQPLIRIVIAAMKKHICFKFHFCILLFFCR